MIARFPDAAAYAALWRALSDRTGLTFAPRPDAEVATRIGYAMGRAGSSDVGEYADRLRRDSDALDALLLELTVGETYFFRDAPQFDLLRDRILPERAHAHAEPLRIWSAGCATGEEPYSIAILLDRLGLAERGRIVGTDLCRGRLAHAARARYGAWSLRQVPDRVVDAYFTRLGDGVELLPHVGERVAFRTHNLADPDDRLPWVDSADLVVCRNVLLYFRRELVPIVARRLLSALRPGGWLVLGVADPVISDFAECDVVTTEAGLVYRRPAADRRPRAVAAAAPPPDRPVAGPVASAMAPAASVAPPPRHAVERVRAAIARGDLETAGRECAAALDGDRLAPELHYLHATLLAEAGHHAESAVAARRVIYLAPESPLGHVALGRACAALADEAGARRAYRRAEALLASLPTSHAVQTDGATTAELLQLVRLWLLVHDG